MGTWCTLMREEADEREREKRGHAYDRMRAREKRVELENEIIRLREIIHERDNNSLRLLR